jgi:membrane-bound metal-dependent hydrolase YbcI (DUF457 family)
MEPITHALTSVALSHAGLNRTARRATWILLAGGLLPDLDLLSLFFGPRYALRYNGTLTHSLLGCGILVFLIAFVFWRAERHHPEKPLRFRVALLLAAIGAAAHLLLDLSNSWGVQLLWPFHEQWFAWFFAQMIDPWILLLLLAGLLLPGLFRLIAEEIGARKKERGPRRGVIASLALVVLYLGARGVLHERAINMLLARDYHGATPIAAGAFPTSASPLVWHGVVATANTLEEVEVPFSPGSYFDPDRSVTHFKPEPTPALAAAEATRSARRFLRFARFPLASLDRTEDGWHFELRDLRFTFESAALPALVVVIELDQDNQPSSEKTKLERENRRRQF